MVATQIADVGNLTLVLGLAVAAYTTLAAIFGVRTRRGEFLASAEYAIYALVGISTLAVGLIEYALVTHQLRLDYVANHVSADQPLLYTLSALWGGQEGSLVFWVWILAIFSAIVAFQNRGQNRAMMAYVTAFLAFTQGFFFTLVVFVSPPFKLLDLSPAQGQGLNPLLQNPGMFIHPITLYLGYVGFTIPFAFAMAALMTGRLSDAWIRTTRRWSLFAWLFLSLGLLFGMRWAYVVLGWGGYWGWDPVENAALIPWLTATAYLHSIMIQEKRGMLKVWNLVLIMLTFILSILGTFLTRSGVVGSVHAFGVGALGPFFLAFMGIVLLAFLYLLWTRLDQLKEDNELDSVLSREATFLLNNLLFVGAAFATLWGTIFPMLSEVFTGKQISVAAPFYNQVNGPIFFALIALLGICTLIGWRRATPENLIHNFLRPFGFALLVLAVLFVLGLRDVNGLLAFSSAAFVLGTVVVEFYRGSLVRVRQYSENALVATFNMINKNRRRYGGYVVHLGIVLTVVGIAGSTFYQAETQINLKPGDTVTLRQYTIRFDQLTMDNQTNRKVVGAGVSVFDGGNQIATMKPEKSYYPAADQWTTDVAVRTTVGEDLYLILAGWENDGSATLKVVVNPLVLWLWVGFGVFIFGTLIAMLPETRPLRVPVRVRTKQVVGAT